MRVVKILLLIPIVMATTFLVFCGVHCGKPFIVQPTVWARKSVEKIDYQMLEYVFRTKPLPDSVQITGVDYVGYSTIFNGPDGPPKSNYEITLNAADYERILKNIQNDIVSRKEIGLMWTAPSVFNSDVRYHYAATDREEDLPFFQLETKDPSDKHSPLSMMVMDDRTSPTLKIYLNTCAYFYMPETRKRFISAQ